jgi:hypothetical protein
MLAALVVPLVGGLAAAPFLDPTGVLLGWLRGEVIFKGRPASYWVEFVRGNLKYGYIPNGVLESFAGSGDAGAAVWLPLINDSDEKMRWAGVSLLARCGHPTPTAVVPLKRALHDQSTQVRLSAALALYQIGAACPEAFETAALLVDDAAAGFSFEAANVLWAMEPTAAQDKFGWREFRNTSEDFRITMPAGVVGTGQLREIRPDVFIEATRYEAKHERDVYFVEVSAYPEGVIEGSTLQQRVQVLQATVGLFIPNGQILEQRYLDQSGHRAWEVQVGAEGMGFLRQRVWWAGNRMYLAGLATPYKDGLRTRWALYFLDSFHSDWDG